MPLPFIIALTVGIPAASVLLIILSCAYYRDERRYMSQLHARYGAKILTGYEETETLN